MRHPAAPCRLEPKCFRIACRADITQRSPDRTVPAWPDAPLACGLSVGPLRAPCCKGARSRRFELPPTAPATPLHSLVAMDRNRWSPSPGARTCGHPCSLASSVWATDGIASWSAEPRHKAAYPSASNLHAILDYSPNMASVMPETASRGDAALAVAGPRNPHI